MNFIHAEGRSSKLAVISTTKVEKNVAKPGVSYFKVIILVLLIMPLFGFSQNAKRVVSLAPSITENIYLIGAQNQLAGCTSFCTQAVADGIPVVGSAVDVNMEKLLSLKPDLVLAMQLTKEQDLHTMRKLGIKYILIPTPKNFDEICSQTLEIGRLTGNEEKADEIIAKAQKKVNELSELAHKITAKQEIFFQLGANPVFTVLDHTFMNDFILLANCRNIFEGLNKGSVTRESVLAKNPDIIVVATMGGFGMEEKKVWESYKVLKAAQNKKIFLISSETSCTPTPNNFVNAFTDMVNFITQ